MLNIVDVESEIIETDSFASLSQRLKSDPSIKHVILSTDLLSDNKNNDLSALLDLTPEIKALLVSDRKMECPPCYDFILPEDSQKETLDKLQSFLVEPDPEVLNGANDIQLSDREQDILKTVALGYSNKEIADELHISINTVITHRKNITEKLGIKTIAGLTVYAMLNGIITPEEVKH